MIIENKKQNMKKFVISDTHFGHKNIIKYDNSCYKTIEEQDEVIIGNWNAVVGNEDIVYHLGDVALSTESYAKRILNRLNGSIILIKGNHEKTVINSLILRKRFLKIYDYLEIKHEGVGICMFHYPIHEWNKCHRGYIHIHGHTHGHDDYDKKYKRLNAGCMLHNYMPINLNKVIDKMSTKETKFHH